MANTLTGINITFLTLYISQDMTVERNRYYKHVFAGGERIATKPCGEPSRTKGDGFSINLPNETDEVEDNNSLQINWIPVGEREHYWHGNNNGILQSYAQSLGLAVDQDMFSYDIQFPVLNRSSVQLTSSSIMYYHYEHTGGTGFISRQILDHQNLTLDDLNTGTRLVQHYQYMPFGELFVHQNTQQYHNPYDFSARERDIELRSNLAYHNVKIDNHAKTGFQYFGARHYHSEWGIWLSVDPLADLAPHLTPYRYAFNNPIRYHDPSGLFEVARASIAPDDHYINYDGSIRTVKTDDNFDRFYIQDNTSETGYSLVGQLNKNNAGLVQFPRSGIGFGRYGSSDAGGISTSPVEIVGQGDHYLQPETAAALYGLVNKLNTDFGFNISLGDMSSSNGSDPWQIGSIHHSGHGHLGNRSGLDVDFRYLTTDGSSFQDGDRGPWVKVGNSGYFNDMGSFRFSFFYNQRLYDVANIFGFTRNYQGRNGNLLRIPKVGGHNDHGHLGLEHKSLDWKYVQTAPTRQNNDWFNWLKR